MKAERVSYDVITPSAARGILEAIYWKPEIRWVIDQIHVLRPIRYASLRRNEVGNTISADAVSAAMKSGSGQLGLFVDEERQQRATILLRDVEYVIDAHFVVVGGGVRDGPSPDSGAGAAKHADQFSRRARSGQCFHRPYLGCREFVCDFELVESSGAECAPVAGAFYGTESATRDLGQMLRDIDFADNPEGKIIEGSQGRRVHATAEFFHARMERGVITIPPRATAGAKA